MNKAAFPWADDVFARRQVQTRVLIVGDGIINFREDTDFGLGELCAVLRSVEGPWEGVALTTAHRSENPLKGANIPHFRFDKKPSTDFPQFSIDHYDQVWLFGEDVTYELDQSEMDHIVNFMNAGGGVFATGDHENLGISLCGKIPRIRSMRYWELGQAPHKYNKTRIDTLRQGTRVGFQLTDQSDGTPQEIRPRFSMESSVITGTKKSLPHPLLRYGDFAVTVLPDHMHEGDCRIPEGTELESTYQNPFGKGSLEEYPRSEDRTRVSPQLVAMSTSASGQVVGVDEVDILPVEPKPFNIIVAYDGHEVKPKRIGRVVVDSSFHHFINLNLKGTGSPGYRGFYDEFGKPTPHYLAIQQYFRNIASWLRTPEQISRYYMNVLLGLRYMSPLIEEVRRESPFETDEISFVGNATFKSIAERLSTTDAVLCAMSLAEALPEPGGSTLRSRIDPWQGAKRNDGPVPMLPDAVQFQKMVLGSAMLKLASMLPNDPYEASTALQEVENVSAGDALPNLIRTGVSQGFDKFRTLWSETIVRNAAMVQSDLINISNSRLKGESMANDCCGAGDWESVRRKSIFEEVRLNGDGTGYHKTLGVPMTYQCSDTWMVWYVRTQTHQLTYSGNLYQIGSKCFVRGHCTTFAFDDKIEGGFRAEDVEEWEGTKTT